MIEKIRNAVEKFNGGESSEANALLISVGNRIIKIKFSGEIPWGERCLNDYFKDMMHNLKDSGVGNKIKWINTDETRVNYLVEYEIL